MSNRNLIERYFTVNSKEDVFDSVRWTHRDTELKSATGEIVFEQKDVEFPDFWSDDAVRITASKYFKGPMGTPKRESSLRQLITRVVDHIVQAGVQQGILAESDSLHNNEILSGVFRDELIYLLLNQYAAFNSPVWFNCGVLDERSAGWCCSNEKGLSHVRQVQPNEHRPQCSACFILSVHDSMESILEWTKTEGMIFKFGSGSGANLSEIRSSKELLSSGGRPSGPLEFMKINDQAAGSIKSGGKHRRAAKMVILNSDHPDIFDFVNCKAAEEKKVAVLVAAGWKNDFADPNGAQASAFFQNANHAVSVSDDFMEAVSNDPLNGSYSTRSVTTGEAIHTFPAGKLLRAIAEAAWKCGDPGMQFRDTMNEWNVVAGSGRIKGSNPCSEYIFLDDSSCNLASLNLMKFRLKDGGFNWNAFQAAVGIMITAQEILVDLGSYPTQQIAQNSHDFRPLGLGYCNLGALLMANGVPYDSVQGRNTAAAITAFMTGTAYLQSIRIGMQIGAFPRFSENISSIRRVLTQHRDAAVENLPQARRVRTVWDDVVELVNSDNYPRNAQVTVLAPTGTIGFMMDCDTTGIEPELSLVKYKNLVGGGQMKIVNKTVEQAIRSLHGDPGSALKYLEAHGHFEGFLRDDLAVFDTAFPAGPSKRCIDYMGHVNMMAAVQPFLSGAISKTVNMPQSATVEEIQKVYLEAWQKGLKCIAIYRNNCKSSQPLQTAKEVEDRKQENSEKHNEVFTVPFSQIESKVCAIIHDLAKLPRDLRRQKIRNEYSKLFGDVDPVELLDSGCHRKLAGDRLGNIHEFKINGHKAYLCVGMYPDGTPAEIFLDMAKEGSTISGLLDAWAICFSFNLQHGVPLRKLVDKFSHTKFEPAGLTDNPDLRTCDSVIDYVVRYLELKFLRPKEEAGTQDNFKVNINNFDVSPAALVRAIEATTGNKVLGQVHDEYLVEVLGSDAPLCMDCGQQMVRNGSCYRCANCGGTSGCS